MGKNTIQVIPASNRKSIRRNGYFWFYTGRMAMNQVLNRKIQRRYRRLGLSNLLKMGHCAPAVMRTILRIRRAGERQPLF